MTPQDTQIIGECLRAVAKGPFLPDWEIDSLIGMSKAEVTTIAERWPEVDMKAEPVQRAVNNALVNLIGYPIDEEEEWPSYISVPRESLEDVRTRFKKATTGG